MSPKNISVSWYTSLDDNHPSTMPGQWLYSFISLLFVLNLLYIFYILYMLHTVYTVYIWYMVYVYIYIWSGCWWSVKKYVASPSRSDLTPPLGSAFGTAKPPGSPRGTLLRWRTVFWDSFWKVGNLQKTRKVCRVGGFVIDQNIERCWGSFK